MKANNPLYKNQGIHVIISLFTVEKGVTKVLLIKRKNLPYTNMWALVGGALYNNENIEDGMKREVFEKTGIKDIEIYFSNVFGRVDRSPIMRMIALSYIGVIDSEKVAVLKDTLKTSDSDWVSTDRVPKLAYDHNEILTEALNTLKTKILSSDILKTLFPNGFTLPEIQKTYESILNKKFDRRNFRKKLLSFDLIIDTNEYVTFEGKKPAKLYKFRNKSSDKNVF
ncbi:MAG: NUDIX domain-containing protein [Bacilli bacterium]|nr:NUDIX domain-containing protein [Bacilli bacterium]MDD3304784.1 NUDIX domain-containing protein [Bacilli bacterium]MDD4053806.1 NUDIX domain-containing protein [Bacilli bacterium]MDD4411620.1 NUDIX domain-containing protein [Bacilli bacterium]